MRRLIFLPALILFLADNTLAQDVIATRSGEYIPARIIELTKSEVRYKRFDEKDTAVYSLLKSSILTIRYESGTKITFNDERSSEEQFKDAGNNPAPEGNLNESFQRENFPQHDMPKQLIPKKDDPQAAIERKIRSYRAMKRTGVVLTILGTAAFAGGMAAMMDISDSHYGDHTVSRTMFEVMAVVSGGVGVGVGIPLWITGAASQSKYRKSLKSVSVSLHVQPRAAGLSIRF